MTQRDAFGRAKGEDPLERLGWTSSATPGQSYHEPVPVDLVIDHSPSGGGMPGGSGGRVIDLSGPQTARRLVRLVVVVAIVLILIVAAGALLAVSSDVQPGVRVTP